MHKVKNLLGKPSRAKAFGRWVGGTAIAFVISYATTQNLPSEALRLKTFGTFRNPKYKITAQVPKGTEIITYNSILSKAKENLEKQEYPKTIYGLENICKRVDTLENYFKSNFHDNEDFKNLDNVKLRGHLNKIYDLRDIVFSLMPYVDIHMYLNKVYESLLLEPKNLTEKKYGTVEDNIKRLTKKMTGKDFPSILDIKEEGMNGENIGGYHSPSKSKIVANKDICYSWRFSNFTHEQGHAFALHNETYFDRLLNLLNGDKLLSSLFTDDICKKKSIMEEACAYSFENAAPYFVDDSVFSDRVMGWHLSYLVDKIDMYFDGFREKHIAGITLADAATEYFGDVSKTFNYLATTKYDEIKPDIWDVVEKNKELYSEVYLLLKKNKFFSLYNKAERLYYQQFETKAMLEGKNLFEKEVKRVIDGAKKKVKEGGIFYDGLPPLEQID